MDSPERRRECLYYLAIGHYKIGNLSDAKKFNSELLRHEPKNEQALDLERRIDEKVSKGKVCYLDDDISSNPMSISEGTIGLAIVGGVVTLGAAILTAILKRKNQPVFQSMLYIYSRIYWGNVSAISEVDLEDMFCFIV